MNEMRSGLTQPPVESNTGTNTKSGLKSGRKKAGQQVSHHNLVRRALIECPDKKLTIHELYHWYCKMYPHFAENPNGGWKNGLRCFLSISQCFENSRKTEKELLGAGANGRLAYYWTFKTSTELCNECKNTLYTSMS